MAHDDGTLTTQIPGQSPHTSPISPSWASVAPLLERWQIALMPQRDRSWDLVSGFPRACGLPVHGATAVLWAALPQAIADVAARCEAAAAGQEDA